MLIPLLIAGVVGYFLGALPFGYWVAQSKGINIFEHGSKNPGATNVRRVLGKGPGNWVFFLDALKGAAAVLAGKCLLGWLPSVAPAAADLASVSLQLEVTALIGALVGHSFSVFTRFRGGKGVATTVGGFLVLMPLVLLIAAAVWAATFFTSRYVSLASILAALSLPASAYFFQQPRVMVAVSAAIAVFVIVRHRANVARLLSGTENKFVKKTAVPK
jgi:glycerol-3-phosphate acyltransferase PlsY